MAHYWNTHDYDLTVLQLKEKYEKRGVHPAYPWAGFREAWPVESADDDEAYWVWVVAQLRGEQLELDSDNPYI